MPVASQESPKSEVTCPRCHGPLTAVSQAHYGGPRFHAELLVLRCAEHGEVFVTREGMEGPGPIPGADSGPGSG